MSRVHPQEWEEERAGATEAAPLRVEPLKRGREEEALAFLAALALDLAARIGNRQAICDSRLLIAEAHLKRGELDFCEEELRLVADETTESALAALSEIKRAADEQAARESVGETTRPAERTNLPQLVLLRLTEAVASRELLLREFAAVVTQETGARQVLIAEHEEESGARAVVCHGWTPAECEEIAERLSRAASESEREGAARSLGASLFDLRPSQRERRPEIPVIANHYIDHFAEKFGRDGIRFSPEAMDLLMVYDWPGNVRQLLNEIQRVAARAESGATITPDQLSPELQRTSAPAGAFSAQATLATASFAVPENLTLPEAVEELERRMIGEALRRHGGNISRAARTLGITRRGLQLKLGRYAINARA